MKPYSARWLQACIKASGLDLDTNAYQREVAEWWFNSDSRFVLILGGERSGKSALAHLLAAACVDITKPGEYWIVGPDYRQARPEFTYIYHTFAAMGLVEGEPSMPSGDTVGWSFKTRWGATFRTRSGADIQKLASFSVDGIIMAEAAQQVHEAYLKLMGRVSETGGFLILNGTLEKGFPWYGDLYERWQGDNTLGARSFSLPTWSNLVIYPGGREDPKIRELESEYPADLFEERFGAKPRRLYGRVLPEFDMKVHVRHLEHNPDYPVHLAIDPGLHCYAVLFLQYIGQKAHVLDRVYTRSKTVYEVAPMAMESPLWKYVVGGHIDNAGKQHHAAKSQIELWRELANVELTGKWIPIEETVETLRFRLMHPTLGPLIFFNDHMTNARDPSGACLDVLAEPLAWEWPEHTPGRNERKKPIDRHNDAMKALGYGLIGHYGRTLERRKAPKPTRDMGWLGGKAPKLVVNRR